MHTAVSVTCRLLSLLKILESLWNEPDQQHNLSCSEEQLETAVYRETRTTRWQRAAQTLCSYLMLAAQLVHKMTVCFPNQLSLFLLYLAVRVLDDALKTVAVIFKGEPVGFKGQENMLGCCPPPCKTTTRARSPRSLSLPPSSTMEQPVYLCAQLRVWNSNMSN